MSVRDIVEGKLDKLGNVSSWCQQERVVFDGWTPIDGKSEDKSKVRLNMKMSFHPKYPTPNMDIFSGDAINQKTKSDKGKEKIRKQHSEFLDVPVAPEHNNGIISVTIHQAVDLEIGDPQVLPTDEKFRHPYSPDKVVSPYAVLYINDNKVYQTRTKLRNPSPVSQIRKKIYEEKRILTFLFYLDSIGTQSLSILSKISIALCFVYLSRHP